MFKSVLVTTDKLKFVKQGIKCVEMIMLDVWPLLCTVICLHFFMIYKYSKTTYYGCPACLNCKVQHWSTIKRWIQKTMPRWCCSVIISLFNSVHYLKHLNCMFFNGKKIRRHFSTRHNPLFFWEDRHGHNSKAAK